MALVHARRCIMCPHFYQTLSDCSNSAGEFITTLEQFAEEQFSISFASMLANLLLCKTRRHTDTSGQAVQLEGD